MTGTPVANRPYDIWAQIFFLDFGKSLGTNFTEFKKTTDLSNDLKKNEEKRHSFEDTVSRIYEKIEGFSVRETKNSCGIQLPQKEYVTEYVDFESIQKGMYESVLRDLEIEMKQDGEISLDDDSVALKRLLRLTQIASNPRLIDEKYKEISAKEVILDDLLTQIIDKGEKCIVWSNYIENIEYFAEKYSFYGGRKIHGSLTIEERNLSVDLFKKDDSCKVLFATPQAAKEGLTLTVANHVIFYDRGFNLDDYLQAQDRIHRISQKRTCYVYNLMVKDSVDEWIDKLLEAKQYAAFLAQGDINKSEYKVKADYSYGDMIREILGSGREGEKVNG
jgi:SNF2 family DNA or RNA helicase